MGGPQFERLIDAPKWWAQHTPDASVTWFEGVETTYAALDAAADAYAHALVAAGVAKARADHPIIMKGLYPTRSTCCAAGICRITSSGIMPAMSPRTVALAPSDLAYRIIGLPSTICEDRALKMAKRYAGSSPGGWAGS